MLSLLIYSSITVAHGGRTNADGCHHNRKQGDYHCHHAKTNNHTSSFNKSVTPQKSNMSCQYKTTCKEMNSCEEAKFYL